MKSDSNPLHHTHKMAARLRETIDHLRADIDKVDEPQFKAMFETSAEVLGGLAEGAVVVMHPSDRVADGVRVSPTNEDR